jgi:hypothetical protein
MKGYPIEKDRVGEGWEVLGDIGAFLSGGAGGDWGPEKETGYEHGIGTSATYLRARGPCHFSDRLFFRV